MEPEDNGDINCNWYTWINSLRITTSTERFGNEEKLRPLKLLHYLDRSEYCEESLRYEETCFHSKSTEKLSDNTAVKNSQKNKLIRKEF